MYVHKQPLNKNVILCNIKKCQASQTIPKVIVTHNQQEKQTKHNYK